MQEAGGVRVCSGAALVVSSIDTYYTNWQTRISAGLRVTTDESPCSEILIYHLYDRIKWHCLSRDSRFFSQTIGQFLAGETVAVVQWEYREAGLRIIPQT